MSTVSKVVLGVSVGLTLSTVAAVHLNQTWDRENTHQHTASNTHTNTLPPTHTNTHQHTPHTPTHCLQHTPTLPPTHTNTLPPTTHQHTASKHTNTHQHTASNTHQHTASNTHQHTASNTHTNTLPTHTQHTASNTHQHTASNTHQHTASNTHQHTAPTHTNTLPPTHTNTLPPTHTPTHCSNTHNTLPPTHTNTLPPEQTHQHTASNTHQHTASNTPPTHCLQHTPTHCLQHTPTHTNTLPPTHTNTLPPTHTNTHQHTASNTHQHTASRTHTNTLPPTHTNTLPPTHTNTLPPTHTNTLPPTHTNTHQHTASNTHQHTASNTHQHTPTNCLQHTPTHPTHTNTHTNTHQHTQHTQHTASNTHQHTPTHTNTHTNTHQHTHQHTASNTQTHTNTHTNTPPTHKPTHTNTHQHTPTHCLQNTRKARKQRNDSLHQGVVRDLERQDRRKDNLRLEEQRSLTAQLQEEQRRSRGESDCTAAGGAEEEQRSLTAQLQEEQRRSRGEEQRSLTAQLQEEQRRSRGGAEESDCTAAGGAEESDCTATGGAEEEQRRSRGSDCTARRSRGGAEEEQRSLTAQLQEEQEEQRRSRGLQEEQRRSRGGAEESDCTATGGAEEEQRRSRGQRAAGGGEDEGLEEGEVEGETLLIVESEDQGSVDLSHDQSGDSLTSELEEGGGCEETSFHCDRCHKWIPAGREGELERMRLTWQQVVMLAMYNLSLEGTGRQGYFRWKEDICAFIGRHWNFLLGTRKKTSTWWSTVAGCLSVGSPTFFRSGAQEFGEPGWWKLVQNRPPTLRPDTEKSTTKAKGMGLRKRGARNPVENAIQLKEKRCRTQEAKDIRRAQKEASGGGGGYTDRSASSTPVKLGGGRGGNAGRRPDLVLEKGEGMIDPGMEYLPPPRASLVARKKLRPAAPHIKREAESEDDEGHDEEFEGPVGRREGPSLSAGGCVGAGGPERRRINHPEKADEEPQTPCFSPLSLYEERMLLRRLASCPLALAVTPQAKRLHRKLLVRQAKRQRGLPLLDVDRAVSATLSLVGGIYGATGTLMRGGLLGKYCTNSQESRILDRFQTNLSSRRGLQQTPVSFCHRLTGAEGSSDLSIKSPYTARILKPYIRRDYESRPVKLRLLEEIRAYPHRKNPNWVPEPNAPIDYCYVRPNHIPSVNAMCNESYWPGVDLSECLQYPDFSVVVLYKKVVIAFGFMVPDVKYNEAYISFLLVHPERAWERRDAACVGQ
ncbi:hypothetical protein F7725_012166 [Dissostichus mawsoni]|uniref:Uncharacterized protein n=1 Tax=Dissostichus mawsoni TaxID=36200 RepID=A0A7J5YLM5_DISMA|nr:hypothetical protein F7725_012166 [Dissostichus mawsoni]